jgi:hypothetical protein
MTDTEPQAPEVGPAGGGRSFRVGEEAWVARVAGTGLGGTGHLASARMVIVRFFRAGDERPASEALLPAGRFDHLFDDELARLLASARPLT